MVVVEIVFGIIQLWIIGIVFRAADKIVGVEHPFMKTLHSWAREESTVKSLLRNSALAAIAFCILDPLIRGHRMPITHFVVQFLAILICGVLFGLLGARFLRKQGLGGVGERFGSFWGWVIGLSPIIW